MKLFCKLKASKLWFSMAVVLIAILNVSPVEAKSLKKGEEFKQANGWAIRVISSDEMEVDGQGNETFLGKYTIDGERVRVVIGMLGTSLVSYYKITPDGLVEEKGGKIYYSKAGLAAEESRKVAAKFTFNGGDVTDKRTGLIWRRCAEGMVYRGGICTGTASEFNHKEALQHAAAQASSTGKSWRVPEKDELASIIEISRYRPSIDPAAFAASPSHFFWSAASPTGVAVSGWVTVFSDGSVVNGELSTDWGGFVRLVRAGQ